MFQITKGDKEVILPHIISFKYKLFLPYGLSEIIVAIICILVLIFMPITQAIMKFNISPFVPYLERGKEFII